MAEGTGATTTAISSGHNSLPVSPVRRYGGEVTVQRTKAMPSNSLFGSVLERLRPEEEQKLASMDMDELKEVARRYEAPKIRGKQQLPLTDSQRALLEREYGADIADWRREFQRQRDNLQRTEGRLRKMHETSRFNLDHPLDFLPSGESMRERYRHQGQWFTEADLEHAAEMNRVGLRGRSTLKDEQAACGYNRDKYGTQPPVHRYGLIGDMFRPGMDFDVASRLPTETVGALPNKDNRQAARLEERREKMRRMPPSNHVIPGSELVIPANIKHKFGTQLCEKILADPDKVEEAKTKAMKEKTKEKPPSPIKELKPPSSLKDHRINPTYELLGGTLRSNVFPGHTKDHHQSSTHRIHTQEVYEKRDAVPDKFRFQWDHVSRWSEANVMHQRMMKGDSEEKVGH